MPFFSQAFLFFLLPISVAATFFVGVSQRQIKLGIYSLIIVSLGFYLSWQSSFPAALALSLIANYGCAAFLGRPELRPTSGKLLLFLGVSLNIALLIYFRCGRDLANVLGLPVSWAHATNLSLPLALQIFTLQQIAFLIDTAQRRISPNDFPRYILFICFFPTLLAGPIVRYQELIPQLGRKQFQRMNYRFFYRGMILITIALGKKFILADTFALWVDSGFASNMNGHYVFDLSYSWFIAFALAFQIYFEWSALTDMALGIALLFGIRLPESFRSPYKARNLREFWGRWHISLTRWFRDYFINPLSPLSPERSRQNLILISSFLLMALWYSSTGGVIFWGMLHASAFWLTIRVKLPFQMPRFLATSMTFLFIAATWIFFRAESLPQAGRIFKGLLGLNGMQFNSWPKTVLQTVAVEPLFFSHELASAFWIFAIAIIFFGKRSLLLLRSLEQSRALVPISLGILLFLMSYYLQNPQQRDFLWSHFY